MAIQQENGRFTLKNAIGVLTESLASHWKPMIVAAPLFGTALFFASSTNAQTSGSAVPSPAPAANGTVAPIASPDAARRKGPKVKEKVAMDTSRVANPPTTTEPTADAPVAPIDAPEAARTGRPKERDKEATGRVANPTPAADPVAAPEDARTGGRPKERDDDARDTSRKARPKERDDDVSTSKKRSSATTTSRGSNLLLPILGGAAAITAIIAVSSGNDRPTSP